MLAMTEVLGSVCVGQKSKRLSISPPSARLTLLHQISVQTCTSHAPLSIRAEVLQSHQSGHCTLRFILELCRLHPLNNSC